ncbi:MAG: DUF3786 domain-containing protein [Candidatus Omnitrophota bacterium]|jgi:hypothetical protein
MSTIEGMAYEAALVRCWEALAATGFDRPASVRFLADEYSVDSRDKSVLSFSCNVPAKDHAKILILHYLAHKLKGLPELSGEWISFKELTAGENYYPAFRKRAIDPVIKKYGSNPDGLFSALDRIPSRKGKAGDISIIVDVFEKVPVQVVMWRGDEEFVPEANMLFDRNIAGIFETEDIAVLGGFIACQL